MTPRRTLLLLSALAVCTASGVAVAQDAKGRRPEGSQHTWLYETSLAAGGDAYEFSNARNAIGVIVYYGPDVDPIKVGDAFANELVRRGVNGRSFAAPGRNNGASVLYQVGASGLGPLGVNTAASRTSEAVKLSQARDRLLSPGNVPPRPRP